MQTVINTAMHKRPYEGIVCNTWQTRIMVHASRSKRNSAKQSKRPDSTKLFANTAHSEYSNAKNGLKIKSKAKCTSRGFYESTTFCLSHAPLDFNDMQYLFLEHDPTVFIGAMWSD